MKTLTRVMDLRRANRAALAPPASPTLGSARIRMYSIACTLLSCELGAECTAE